MSILSNLCFSVIISLIFSALSKQLQWDITRALLPDLSACFTVSSAITLQALFMPLAWSAFMIFPSLSAIMTGFILSASAINAFIPVSLPFFLRFSRLSSTKRVSFAALSTSISFTISSKPRPASLSSISLLARRVWDADAPFESIRYTLLFPFSSLYISVAIFAELYEAESLEERVIMYTSSALLKCFRYSSGEGQADFGVSG